MNWKEWELARSVSVFFFLCSFSGFKAARRVTAGCKESCVGFLVRFGGVEIDRKECDCSGQGCETAAGRGLGVFL